MGSLRNIPVRSLLDSFGCHTLIETGSGLGGSISFAKDLPLSHIYSCEINEYLFNALHQIYDNNNRVTLYHSSSEVMLKSILPGIGDSNIIFWLDAHFPGADFGLDSYDAENDERIRLPLETELRIIKNNRQNFNDVIIIDDLRIYEDGPFGNGPAPLPDRLPRGQRTLDFINDLFGDSHTITRIYLDEGYIFITPKVIRIHEDKYKKISSQLRILLSGDKKEQMEAIRRTQFYFSLLENEPGFFSEMLNTYKNIVHSDIENEHLANWDRILNSVKNDAEIIVYGTGFHALLITKIAKENNLNIAYYASSNDLMVGQLIDDKPVLSIDGIFQSSANIVIVASTGSRDRIVDKIKLKEITNGNKFVIL